MSKELNIPSRNELPSAIESLLGHGDLGKLTTEQRIEFYKARCLAANLDPRSRPFQFITLNGKLVLYATKECAEQLNGLHGLSHQILSRTEVAGIFEVIVRVSSKSGRTSEDVGCVVIDGLKGESLANARMKAVTKAKRRATLSFCGMGDVIDESELDTVRWQSGDDDDRLAKNHNNNTGYGSGAYTNPGTVQEYQAWCTKFCERINGIWMDFLTDKHTGEVDTTQSADLVLPWNLSSHLLKFAKSHGWVDCPEESFAGTRDKYAATAWSRYPDEIEKEAKEFCRKLWEIARNKPKTIPREPGCDDELICDEIPGPVH